MSANAQRVLEAHGYSIVYLQSGQIDVGDRTTHAPSSAAAFIAVKKTLADEASLTSKTWT